MLLLHVCWGVWIFDDLAYWCLDFWHPTVHIQDFTCTGSCDWDMTYWDIDILNAYKTMEGIYISRPMLRHFHMCQYFCCRRNLTLYDHWYKFLKSKENLKTLNEFLEVCQFYFTIPIHAEREKDGTLPYKSITLLQWTPHL